MNRILLLSVAGTLIAACSTPAIDTSTNTSVPSAPSSYSQDRIREPETVKEYSFNPYIDPNNPDVRYSEGVIHKVEQTPQWNLTPSVRLDSKTASTSVTDTSVTDTSVMDTSVMDTSVTDTNVAIAGRKNIEEGPMEEVANDQVISPSIVPAKLEQELARERQLRQALADQLQGQIEVTKEFAKQLVEVKQVAEQNRQLREDLQAIKDAEEKRVADEKAKADAEAARKALPFYQRWFSTSQTNNK